MPNKQNYEKITLAATTLNDPTKMKIMEYSGDPNTEHSINGTIWIMDFHYSVMQAMILDIYVADETVTLL